MNLRISTMTNSNYITHSHTVLTQKQLASISFSWLSIASQVRCEVVPMLVIIACMAENKPRLWLMSHSRRDDEKRHDSSAKCQANLQLTWLAHFTPQLSEWVIDDTFHRRLAVTALKQRTYNFEQQKSRTIIQCLYSGEKIIHAKLK